MSCLLMSSHVMSCLLLSSHVFSYHVMSSHVFSYHVMSFHVRLGIPSIFEIQLHLKSMDWSFSVLRGNEIEITETVMKIHLVGLYPT